MATNRRYLRLAFLLLGCIITLSGLVLTLLSAYLVNHQIDSAGEHVTSPERDTMQTFFHSMNHFAAVAVGITVCGMIILIATSIASARSRLPEKPGKHDS